MHIEIIDRQQTLTLSPEAIRTLVASVIQHEKQQCDEVGVYFVDAHEIAQLHNEFFQDPTPTDCISFPLDSSDVQGERYLGEIFICPEVALQYAIRRKKNPYHEVTLYVVHALLHLMGYDDMEEKTRVVMRAAERRHMRRLARNKQLLT